MGYYYMGYGFVIIAAILSMIAQSYVKSSYNKFSRIATSKGMSGAQIAQYILTRNGITDVQVVESRNGLLSDHFDPNKKIVALSPEVFRNSSIASVAVAAHEVGHAIQYDTGYFGIKIRTMVLGPAIVASKLSGIFIMIGILFINSTVGIMFDIGIILLGVVTLFQILTLPIEFDASSRALKNIQSEGLLVSSEYSGAKTMLQAAALTYVAAAAGSIMNLMRFIMIRNSRRD
ncbi:MAG: zinc metallopeptidase [Erysipelothrix sp.]|nr:zinc metallopeptidase [Erysipelothrix sp.]